MPFKRFVLAWLLISTSLVFAQSQPASDPQALTYAAQSIATITAGTPIGDVTLTGNAAWNAGADTGTVTLKALGAGESRLDLALTSGTRTEIRDVQTGALLGKWINPDNSAGQFALHNCWTDAVWFFPPLSSLSVGPNIVLSYIGQETRDGGTVQHIQSYVYQSNQGLGTGPNPQQLSTMDFYLDASTLLPVAVNYYTHPDNDAGTNLSVEVDFSQYQTFSGISVPTRITRFRQGNVDVDVTVVGASFNSGLSLSDFTVN